MRLLVLSDLHLEFSDFNPPTSGFDAVVLAGDIAAPGVGAVRWAHHRFGPQMPVLLVPGNHEYYGSRMAEQLAAMREAALGTAVQVLDRDACVIAGVRFLGCTLWTDFALRIDTDAGARSDPQAALDAALGVMVDYRKIRVADRKEALGERLMRPQDTRLLHAVERDWLRAQLEAPFEGPTVVVTHHGPHRLSLAAHYARDWVSAAFINELPEAFFKVPALWLHGHTHTSFDYRVGGCRVVCNPRGYVSQRRPAPENPRFVADLVLKLELS